MSAEAPKVWYAPNKFQAYGKEEIEAVTKCLESGWLAPGPLTAEFEQQVADRFAKKFGVMVNSGSSANLIGLLLCVEPGDDVVTPACTFSTTVAPIVQIGANPIFTDVAPNTFVPTVEMILAAITPKTTCLMIPDLLGSTTDWVRLKAEVDKINAARGTGRKIVTIQDSCDTIRPTPDSDIAITSFYASHVITAGGGGGMLMMNTEAYRDKALMIRDWGRVGNNTEEVSERFKETVDNVPYDFKFLYAVPGYNMKSTEMNAAFGLAQMKKLDTFFDIRRKNFNRYMERLQGSSYTLPVNRADINWLAFPLQHPDRMKILSFLEENNVQTRVLMAGNVTRHPAYRKYLQEFPESDKVMAQGFLVGAHHGLTIEDVDRVCDLLLSFEKK